MIGNPPERASTRIGCLTSDRIHREHAADWTLRKRARGKRTGRTAIDDSEQRKAPVLPVFAISRATIQAGAMGGTGLEPLADSVGETAILQTGGAESGAVGARQAPLDPALALVIEAWPALSEAAKTGILAMIRRVN